MRNATCAESQTSKVPTQVSLYCLFPILCFSLNFVKFVSPKLFSIEDQASTIQTVKYGPLVILF